MNEPIVISVLGICFFLILYIFSLRKERSDLKIEINKKENEITGITHSLSLSNETLSSLRLKYKPIIDIEEHANNLLVEATVNAELIHSEALKKAELIEQERRDVLADTRIINSKAKEKNQGLKQKLEDADIQVSNLLAKARTDSIYIIESAEQQAKEIAGNAYDAKNNADKYQLIVTAMKNTINGYNDEYIIPNRNVLDDLADEYSYTEAGEQLKISRTSVKNMVRHNQAAMCDYVETKRKEFAINFVVDAFNGKVDSALSKVRHDNYGKIKQEILDAYNLVNFNGQPFKDARILKVYLETRLTELKWAVTTNELRKAEREEQAAIKSQIREEERAIKEMEKAKKEAEKEERIIQKALDKARLELAQANSEQKAKYEAELAQLEIKLKEAEDRGQRAISMAQQTRSGHVYVISNIGSFGENVFKIGMTRRLEPLDRVKELGDASVPFSFDVHAMIYSDDAPTLEKALHKRFEQESMNKINLRKEFFKAPLSVIRQAVKEQGISDIHWTMKADAAEYRESLAIEQANQALTA
ncbi:DUF4041 domain-containing protein [Photobacterium toruni]|uniref:DUF4041 domain-containing protein n=1 Tax=Photobacterium toruni TaxID=1935446 RepID=A0ABU6L1C5_9GAMM|nr:DUF4041 domain-containing protein [Photobacterium toruni]